MHSIKHTAILPLCLSCLLVSCGGGSGVGLRSIMVSPGSASVAAGFTQQYSAVGNYSDGSSIPLTNAEWTTSDTAVATLDTAGLATALKQGTVTITASLGLVSKTALLKVGPPIPLKLNIVPANAKVLIGAAPSTKLASILTYSDGSISDVSTSSTWSNTNSFIASINSSGNVTPLRPGWTGASATNGTFSANTGFTVLAKPKYLYFTTDEGQNAFAATIDSNTGQPQIGGLIPTGVTNQVFPCPTSDPLNQFLYVESATVGTGGAIVGGELQTYRIDPATGALSTVAGSPFFSAPSGCVDFEPSGKFGFVTIGVNSATFLVTYSRDVNTGILTLANSANLGAVPTRTAIDPLGKFLYIGASFDGFNTTFGLGFSIDSTTGTLTAIPGSPFTLSKDGGTFTFHPSGNYLYVANSSGQSIDTYSVERSTGALTLINTMQTCINPTPLRFSPDGGFAYTTCSMTPAHVLSPSLETFAVGADGALTHLGSVPTLALVSDLTVDPSGQFLYLSTAAPYILFSTVDANGVAQTVEGFGTQPNPSLSNVVVGGS
jgi:6-phosphogluconolactonase (cycloisomerase 2 family)